ncbi:hypothetical protein FUA23_20800 [Neolewinella aurantiaca]|uniref:Glycosyltransferase RgtA/B/C/D-like domain-containing protein n=1 Tax=Neolewinella aurantiaca TaxID=2602767 RepID=A0A5C7FG47_9BACT|nr:hypothetical protein [Neolewinella aurantiaca]TXF85244.1 hypothetical protein FUA23_20800 [Neolewinella aurantiaca]
MSKKDRLKKSSAKPAPEVPEARSSRFQFFLWISGFFFVAALLLRGDVITVWPGAEGFSLDHALSNQRGGSMLSFLYHKLFPLGEAIDAKTQAIWLFPRLLSAVAVLATAVFTYRFAGKLFGKSAIGLGLVCAGASLFLPFFGKVATPDALALLGQAGFFWTILLAGADKENNHLLPAGIFLLLGGIAAPLSTLVFGLTTIVAARMLMGGGKQWMMLLTLLALPLVVLVLQGNQGVRSYWFWGGQPLAYGKFIGYTLIGMAPLFGWLMGGIRDLIYKVQRKEQTSQLLAAGIVIGLLTQSLVFPLLLALVAGKQMQLYFREEHYPWRDWVRGGATLHLIFAFIATVIILSQVGVSFPGPGFRAALGMGAAYWMFSLFSVIGLYGDRRDFAIGGSVLSGLLVTLFFWVQVYPYYEATRDWPTRVARQIEVKLPTYVPPTAEYSNALPYFRRAGIPVDPDSTTADLQLVSWSPADTLQSAGIEVTGRIVWGKRVFGVRVAE